MESRTQTSSGQEVTATQGEAASRPRVLRHLLEARRALLVERIRAGAPAAPAAEHGAAPHTLLELAVDIERELQRIAAATLRQLDLALERLALGTYGNCRVCTEPISPLRLQSLPFAVRCERCNESSAGAPRRERRRLGTVAAASQRSTPAADVPPHRTRGRRRSRRTSTTERRPATTAANRPAGA